MARTQAMKRRLFGFAGTSNPAAGLATSPTRPQAPAGDLSPVSEASGMASRGTFARMRRFFHRSSKGPSTTVATETTGADIRVEAQEQQGPHHAGQVQETTDTNTGDGAQGQQETPDATPAQDLADNLEPELTLEVVWKDIEVAVKALDDMNPISRIGIGVVEAVYLADTAVIEAQSMSNTYLKPFKTFSQVVNNLSSVHPYALIALVVLTSASQLIIHHANIDNPVSGLLDKVRNVYEFLLERGIIDHIKSMKDGLMKIARAVSESAQFITNYFGTKNFWLRAGKNVFSETRTIVRGYVEALDNLMQQYRDPVIRNTRFKTYRIFGDLSLEGMAHADGAGFRTTKKCLDGTKTEILLGIINWINDPDVDTRLLLLHGRAGRGKSAIGHTFASWIEDAGGLGSCFCFHRDRQVERREEKILATITRDLADRDPAFRPAMVDVVAKDRSLKTTPDVMQQWRHFILEPLLKANGAIVGNVIVAIDALDESGPNTSREHFLRRLTSKEAARLLSDFRVFLASRPLPGIEPVLRITFHVKVMSLGDIPVASTEQDIRLYVSSELRDLREIGTPEIQNISWKSDGLLEWARLACKFIEPNRPGQTIMEHYSEVMFPRSGGGGMLLDAMYRTILEDTVPEEITLARFYSVMQRIMSLSVPLQLDTLNEICSHFPSKEDQFDMVIIPEFMAPLLSGISDRLSVVWPLHASFHDFLTDHLWSGVYFVGTTSTGVHGSLAFASLQTLCNDLKFNICGLEIPYSCDLEVADLQERINENISLNSSYSSHYWGHYLERAIFDPALASLVKLVIGSAKILFWLKTLSLLGGHGHITSVFTPTVAWLQDQEGLEDALALVQDGIKFLQSFAMVISCSASHLYVSAPPFTSSNTMPAKMLVPKLSGLPGISVGGLRDWPLAQPALHVHTDEVNSVGFSFDRKRIVSGSDDNPVRVWDAERGIQVGGPLEGHTGWVNSVGFSSDGKKIVSGSADKTVRVWDAETDVQIGGPLEGHTGGANPVGFSPNGKRVVSGSDDKAMRVWDSTEKGVCIGGLEGPTSAVNSVGFSPDGKRIVSGMCSKAVRVWGAERGAQIYGPAEGQTGGVNLVEFPPIHKRIVSGLMTRL